MLWDDSRHTLEKVSFPEKIDPKRNINRKYKITITYRDSIANRLKRKNILFGIRHSKKH